VGLAAALSAFPASELWGIDLSPVMLSQGRKRNLKHVVSSRLTLGSDNVTTLVPVAPIDIVLAIHVLYFWHQLATELMQLHAVHRPGGALSRRIQLRQHMPGVAPTNFPNAEHVLHDSDEEPEALLTGAGFRSVNFVTKGSEEAPQGRLALEIA
jgi:trans-aconitate methyltransferase